MCLQGAVSQEELLSGPLAGLTSDAQLAVLNPMLSSKKVRIYTTAAGAVVYKLSTDPPDPRC